MRHHVKSKNWFIRSLLAFTNLYKFMTITTLYWGFHRSRQVVILYVLNRTLEVDQAFIWNIFFNIFRNNWNFENSELFYPFTGANTWIYLGEPTQNVQSNFCMASPQGPGGEQFFRGEILCVNPLPFSAPVLELSNCL